MSCNVFSTRTWCRRQRVRARASSTRAKSTSARRSRDKKKHCSRDTLSAEQVSQSRSWTLFREHVTDMYISCWAKQWFTSWKKKTSRMVFNFNPSSIVTKRLIILSFHSGTALARYTTAYVVYWFFTRYSNFTNICNHDQNSNEMRNHETSRSFAQHA